MNRLELEERSMLLTKLVNLNAEVNIFLTRSREPEEKLRVLRDAVSEAKGMPHSPQEMAALVDLQDVLSWAPDVAVLWQHYRNVVDDRVKAIQEIAPSDTALARAISKAHHEWRNAASVAVLISEDRLREAARDCRDLLEGAGCPADLPERELLRSLLRSADETSPAWQDMLDYLRRHCSVLKQLCDQASAGVARWDSVGQRRRRKRIRHILIVEDQESWRELATNAAREALVGIGDVNVAAVSDCASAREFVRASGVGGVLAVCDIGLPANAEEAAKGLWSWENGWSSIQELSSLCPVIALTSISQLDVDFARLGHAADDFVLKEGSTCKDELAMRLGAYLRPVPPEQLRVVVPSFDAERILVAGVWVRLKPMSFAIVDALAYGVPSTPEEYFGLLPKYWREQGSTVVVRGAATEADESRARPWLTLEELKIVMCRREIGHLDADFMETLGRSQLDWHLQELRVALREAFEPYGVVVDADTFVETTQPEDTNDERALLVRLASPALVCDTPEEFFLAQGSRFRVLVVEDDSSWRTLIVEELRLLGSCDVAAAATYEEAMQAAGSMCPHLVSLDLCIPRAGSARPEHGLQLREELTRASGGTVRFVVMTSYDLATLRKELGRAVPQGDLEPPPSDEAGMFTEPCRKVHARSIILKQRRGPGREVALKQLRIEAWRAQQEWRSRALLPEDALPLHAVEVAVGPTWGLRLDGKEVRCTARGKNRVREHALIRVLGMYANVPLRAQALLDYWRRHGLLDDVHNPTQQLRERVENIRRATAKDTGAGYEEVKREVIVGCADGYALRGIVTTF